MREFLKFKIEERIQMRKCEVFRKVQGAHGLVKIGTVNTPAKGAWKKGVSYDVVADNLPLVADTIAQIQYGGSAVRTRDVITNKSRQPQGALLYRSDE